MLRFVRLSSPVSLDKLPREAKNLVHIGVSSSHFVQVEPSRLPAATHPGIFLIGFSTEKFLEVGT